MTPEPIREPRHAEDGFTLVELIVTMSLMMIVLGMFLGLLSPMTRATIQTNAVAGNQQKVRFAMLQLSRDLRAGTLSGFSSASTYSSQSQMNTITSNVPGSGRLVCWVYDSATGDLYRLQPTSPNASGCTVPAGTLPALSGIQASSSPMFTYYDAAGNAVSPPGTMPAAWGGNAQDIAACATSIHIQFTAQPDPQASPYKESTNVALRNQLPGGQPTCP